MEAVDIRPQATTDNDRLLITLLLAGLFHLIVILGVTFVPDDLAGPGAVPSIEVMLVNDSVPASTRNEDAAYLAQRVFLDRFNLIVNLMDIPTSTIHPPKIPPHRHRFLCARSLW